MTIALQTMPAGTGLRCWAGSGVSHAASIVTDSFERYLDHFLRPRLDLILPEIDNLSLIFDAESVPVDAETMDAAKRFAYSLPRLTPLPEVSADPDGEISFDWSGNCGEMFSVSVNGQGRLAFAGWFAEGSRIHGTEQLAENCPQEVVRGIQRATR